MSFEAEQCERLADALDIVKFVEASFPSARFTNAHRERYAADIVHLDPVEVLAAVEVLKRTARADGRASEFPPPAGDVCREVAKLQLDAPDWSECKRQLVRRWDATVEARDRVDDWRCPHDLCDGSGFVVDEDTNSAWDCDCRPARREARRGEPLHPLLREFIDDGYVTWGEVEAVGRGMATTLEAQMRAKWIAFSERAVQSRAIAAIEGPPTLRRLGSARHEDALRGGRPVRQIGAAVDAVVAALPRG